MDSECGRRELLEKAEYRITNDGLWGYRYARYRYRYEYRTCDRFRMRLVILVIESFLN